MKKIFTLAAAGALATASLCAKAQAPFTVDGQLTADEVTAGKYVLLGKYTNIRGFGNAGLLSLYAASTTTKLYIFVGGTVEANGNAFQLFLDLPAVAGVPIGTALPGGAGTSFTNMKSKLDLAADLGLALRSDGSATPANSNYLIEGIAYTSATAATAAKLTTATGPLLGDGTALTLSTTTATGDFARLAGARIAYKVAAMAGISGNPGNTATTSTGTPPVTTYPASYGGVGSYGWEIEIDRATAGLTGTPSASLFVVQNGGDGGYISTDFIPQTSAPIAPVTNNPGNPGTGAYDFTTVPDRQAANIILSSTGVLGARAADADALALQIYPNPTTSVATIEYSVGGRAENVSIMLTDLLGRNIQSLASGLKPAGKQSALVSTANVAAGTYLVRVQVGDKVSTRKVVLL